MVQINRESKHGVQDRQLSVVPELKTCIKRLVLLCHEDLLAGRSHAERVNKFVQPQYFASQPISLAC